MFKECSTYRHTKFLIYVQSIPKFVIMLKQLKNEGDIDMEELSVTLVIASIMVLGYFIGFTIIKES